MRHLLIGLVLGLVLATSSNLNAGRLFDGEQYNQEQRFNSEKSAADQERFEQQRFREEQRHRSPC